MEGGARTCPPPLGWGVRPASALSPQRWILVRREVQGCRPVPTLPSPSVRHYPRSLNDGGSGRGRPYEVSFLKSFHVRDARPPPSANLVDLPDRHRAGPNSARLKTLALGRGLVSYSTLPGTSPLDPCAIRKKKKFLRGGCGEAVRRHGRLRTPRTTTAPAGSFRAPYRRLTRTLPHVGARRLHR